MDDPDDYRLRLYEYNSKKILLALWLISTHVGALAFTAAIGLFLLYPLLFIVVGFFHWFFFWVFTTLILRHPNSQADADDYFPNPDESQLNYRKKTSRQINEKVSEMMGDD